MSGFWANLYAPSMWQNADVTHALEIGVIVSIISGVIGIFVVLRGQSFVGHVLTDIGAAGASGSFLLGVSAWYGFISFGLLAGTGVEVMGDRARNRDIATGIILSFAMGLGALFLYFDSKLTSNPDAPNEVMFGSIFTIDPSVVPSVIISGLIALFGLLVLYRPLLLCSISPDVARSRGIPVRVVGILFMLCLSISVEDGALVVGALLSTAMVVGAPAIAMRLTSRIGMAAILSALVGAIATCLGIVLAYDSYNWLPSHRGWPVSFFVASLIVLFYLLSRLWPQRGFRRGYAPQRSEVA